MPFFQSRRVGRLHMSEGSTSSAAGGLRSHEWCNVRRQYLENASPGVEGELIGFWRTEAKVSMAGWHDSGSGSDQEKV